MKATVIILKLIVSIALFGASALGQQRTFVSGLGSDSNPCTRTAPCRTFNQALSLTNVGGEVVALDSAGYGAFAITKAVTVQAPPGVYAGISVFSGDGIDINAGGTDTVILRGLTVNNQGSMGSGIVFNTGGTLHIESCIVNGFPGDGILCIGGSIVEVKDSIVRGNGGGIDVRGTPAATLDFVRIEANQTSGLLVQDGAKVTVRNSVASRNAFGLAATSGTSAAAELNIENCLVSNNITGVVSRSDSTGIATVRIAGSTVTDNSSVGLVNIGSPALMLSRGNNTVEGNTVDTSGVIGSYSAK